MPDRSPSKARAKLADRKAGNRRARLMDALDADDQGVTLLLAAIDYWRATCKRAAPDTRLGHRRRLADLIVADADQWVDAASTPINFTRLEQVA